MRTRFFHLVKTRVNQLLSFREVLNDLSSCANIRRFSQTYVRRSVKARDQRTYFHSRRPAWASFVRDLQTCFETSDLLWDLHRRPFLHDMWTCFFNPQWPLSLHPRRLVSRTRADLFLRPAWIVLFIHRLAFFCGRVFLSLDFLFKFGVIFV